MVSGQATKQTSSDGQYNGLYRFLVQEDELAFGAAVPALGLSNKAIYLSENDVGEEGPDLAPAAQPAAISERPLEEHLQQSSLWPEVYKVYGHGNEIFSLAGDPSGEFMASACKSQVKTLAPELPQT